MNKEFTFNSEMALAYEKNTRISIPTYDTLFAMVQSYYRAQLGEKAASLLVIGAGGGNELSAWLAESGFTNITRFYSTGLFAGWICHAE